MSVVAPVRPAGLQGLKEVPPSVPSDLTTYCAFHGTKNSGNCDECDQHYPAEVLAARVVGAAPLSMGILPADVNAMIDAAVKAAVAEALAFERWKASPEGQAAAAAAKTAGVVPPDHSSPTFPPVNPQQV